MEQHKLNVFFIDFYGAYSVFPDLILIRANLIGKLGEGITNVCYFNLKMWINFKQEISESKLKRFA